MTVEEVYKQACDAYGKLPNDGQMQAWLDVLGEYTVSEIREALGIHQSDTTSDSHGEIRGKWFPSPADLKRIISSKRDQARMSGKQRRWWCGQNGCREGWVRRTFWRKREDGSSVEIEGVEPCECRRALARTA